MKTSQIFLFALMSCISAWAQTNTFPSTGDVGIGTTTPRSVLNITGNQGLDWQESSDKKGTGLLTLGNPSEGASMFINTPTHNSYYPAGLGIDGSYDNRHSIINLKAFGVKYLDWYSSLAFHTSDGTSLNEAMRINRFGNVGIGTSNPISKLEVNGDISLGRMHKIKFLETVNGGDRAYIRSTDGEGGDYNSMIFAIGGGNESMIIKNDGNIGISTQNPSEKLHVAGNALFEENNGTSIKINGYHGIETQGNSHWLHLNRYRNDDVSIGHESTSNVYMVYGGGKVGIGTISPDDKLTVKGRIHAEEVKVDLSVPGPDYVFNEGYDLKSLEEVQEHIRENGHLPNIPSAAEMEQNGVELGIMNMKLLEKIEELTLYTIAQEKRIKHLEKENETLKSITERVAKIEALVEAE
ncbi:tail fiber protein [Ulvibacterium marinum]|uniref:tail fiber protein n=1 Tax=Ulvibacterium marinum TaxID=2419782 RepID=UPI002494F739|nr:tail fiber protein [Ulvibacterium marinum]